MCWCAAVAAGATVPAAAGIDRVELTPTAVGSGTMSFFTVRPTADPDLFLGLGAGADTRRVDFNTAPDGTLFEGASLNTQYASIGVTMNDIRISSAIYGGNNYGFGFATEDNIEQVFTFSDPVIAVGIVNTSPDQDLVRFYSGPAATGDLLDEFRDQEGLATNFTIDRFVGGVATGGTRIGSFSVSNTSGDLELDELIFVVAPPACNDADLAEPFGLLDLADVTAFVGAFVAADPTADLNDDGLYDLGDLTAFVAAFNAGCP
jgi:hypothetical protein